MYELGVGVPQSYTDAIRLYRKSAAQDNAGGQFSLASAYYTAHGVDQDLTKAFDLFANQGNVSAQNNLKSMYENGLGVKQDSNKAKEWYQKTADQGNAIAQSNFKLISSKSENMRRNETCSHGKEQRCMISQSVSSVN